MFEVSGPWNSTACSLCTEWDVHGEMGKAGAELVPEEKKKKKTTAEEEGSGQEEGEEEEAGF